MNKFSYDYDEIVKSFGEKKLAKRYDSIETAMSEFIRRFKLENKVKISTCLLNQAIIDYFTDIYRLKDFHKIDKINYIKIHAYSAYWLLKRKPIQILEDDTYDDNVDLTFINEDFIASYLIHFLNENKQVVIKEKDRDDYMEFYENLKYSLRYRLVTSQSLETMLEAYVAGRRFEDSVNSYN